MKKLTFDFQNFNKRCRKKYGGYEYIAVNEPQSNGNWHIHCILIFSHKAPFMDPGEVKYKLWQQGNVDIHNIDNITNIAAYLTSYLQDAEDSESTDKDEQSSRSGTQELNDDLNCKSENPNQKTPNQTNNPVNPTQKPTQINPNAVNNANKPTQNNSNSQNNTDKTAQNTSNPKQNTQNPAQNSDKKDSLSAK